jgi:poly(glycerol-phosphate) alpha-glucosyltransferase
MLFFINSTFSEKNSGIEHAQLKRAALFRDRKEAFKMIFRDWNPQLHRFLKDNGVSQTETLAMFDYFQKAEQVEEKIIHVEDVDFGVNNLTYNKEAAAHRYIIQQGQQIVGRANYYMDDPTERISTVEYFDGFGNLYRVDFYDFRGFLSLAQWYTPDNMVGTEVWYSPDGKPVLETFNRFDGQNKYGKMGWRLLGKNGKFHTFSNIDELTLYFFFFFNEEFWNPVKLNIFIMDRSHLADWALVSLERPAYTVLHLHNSHAGDAQDPMHSVMNNFYEYGLTNVNKYDAVISATEKQTQDVNARFEPKAKLFTIPVGVVPDVQFKETRIPMSERVAGKVLVTARVAPEKRIDHIVQAVGIAKEKIPHISLDVYGYIDSRNNNESINNINAAIEKYSLQDAVTINEYAHDVASIQKKAQIYGLASIMEGFNLSLMEAISNGMVGLTYDVNYGPNELIVDGENGYVLPYDGIQNMADRLVELFTDESKLQWMSDRSYDLAERYSEKNVWKAWKALLDDAASKSVNYIEPITSGLGDQRIK